MAKFPKNILGGPPASAHRGRDYRESGELRESREYREYRESRAGRVLWNWRREESSVSRETSQSSETEVPSRIPTALAETGAGLVGGLGSALTGLVLGVMVCGKSSNVAGIPAPSGCAVIATLAGYVVRTSVSVWGLGEAMGWDGSLLPTFAGLAVGVVAAIGFPPL